MPIHRPRLAPLTSLVPVLALVWLAAPFPLRADPRPRPPGDAATIRLALDRLNVLGSALYVAAHPDDENTAFLSWLQSGKGVRTGYLSMTRGDGGQNLIGSETGVLLGVIRTQELLSARRVDGAEQYFTRALDFGFSKNSEETLRLWGHDRILADVVWVIRRFQPDVIVSRFPPDSTAGHGHHTASGMLAEEAFAAAADPRRFPEQLVHVKPWQAKRLVWNVFRFGSQGADTTPGRVVVDVGDYSPVLGRAYSEIAGESRSMHKSQGFGAAERRGTLTNTFQHRLGDRASADLFDGVDLSWNRVPGGARVAKLLERAQRAFDPERPHLVVPSLLQARQAMASMPDGPLVRAKRQELDELIRDCAGLWLEAVALVPSGTPGTRVRVALTAIQRGAGDAVVLERVEVAPAGVKTQIDRTLALNRPVTDTLRVALGADLPVTQPYWLEAEPTAGAFVVSDAGRIGDAENPPALAARFVVRLAGERVAWDVPVVYRWVDRVQGERYRDFLVAPPLTLRFDEHAYLFPDRTPRPVRVTVTAGDAGVSGALRLTLPDGWHAEPGSAAVALGAAAAETTVRFLVTPAGDRAAATLGAELETGGRRYDRTTVRIDYPHIPLQILFPRATAHAVRADLALTATRVGYLAGSGDEIPAALRQMGAQVTSLSDDEVETADLSRFEAIVAGVRAYNTRPRLRALQPRLLDYVSKGGRLVVQYNTNEPGLGGLGPYPFTISRDRVTVEEAPVERRDPDHALLTQPNRIDDRDFSGWVQERGLYFAQPFDAHYQAPLSSHDPGEPPSEGGLLFARHGRGVFIYTGYAWFRQLPAGVPGAWRLFANLVSATPPRP